MKCGVASFKLINFHENNPTQGEVIFMEDQVGLEYSAPAQAASSAHVAKLVKLKLPQGSFRPAGSSPTFIFHKNNPTQGEVIFMEDQVGLEPTTPCLKGRCSNQLSYWSIL